MKEEVRMSGAKIMAGLIVMLGSFAYILLLAVLNGSLGMVCAMGVTIFGAVGVAKAIGDVIAIPWAVIICGAILCGVARGGLRYLEQYSNHYIAFKLLAILRDKIFGKLRELCPAKLESEQKGSIIAMLTSDIETLEVFYAHTISPICIAVIVELAVFIFVALTSSIYLALVALVGDLVIGVLLPLISSSRMKAAGVNYRKEFASFNAYFLDSIKGIMDIVLYGGQGRRKEEVDRRSEDLLKETKTLKRETTKASSLTEAMVSVFILITLAVGLLLVAQGLLSPGHMVIGVVAVFGSFGPVISVSALPGNLAQTFASGDRVLKLLDEEPAVREITNGKDISFENLDVKDVGFGYDADIPVLGGVSLNINAGEIVGIVGESGSGKSTLLKLLLRFWQKNEGEIKYSGTEIEDVNTESLLENVTMVSQSTYLFDDTIEENLRIAKPDATQEELEAACRQASIHDFIMKMPDGYATRAGVMGDNLSAGEKQRIGLARAFLRGSRLVLLDEPTSNVDSINEGIILSSIAANRKDVAYILVSHRASTMAIADRIYRMEGGKLISNSPNC
ncbi:MAG: ABC transporter ATP-binding protein/permease [Clostridiales bacterium]|nr:ABC transporter ATP-binding protein/permease [Clostridiales bacterium]